MKDFSKKIGIENENWLMSNREKLVLIGLLQCMKPKKTIEFGYHLGGSTRWLSEYSENLITVDVNEFVNQAKKDFNNVEVWNCSTSHAISRIKEHDMHFDLALVDADHSRNAVCEDISGLLGSTDVIVMHDSYNPACRRGMLDALKNQKSHAYNLDFIQSILKHDGLWGGFGIAWKSNNPGISTEFLNETSSYNFLALRSLFQLRRHLLGYQKYTKHIFQKILSKISF